MFFLLNELGGINEQLRIVAILPNLEKKFVDVERVYRQP